MSLFPQGSSGGMQAFQGGAKPEKKEEKQQEAVVKQEVIEEKKEVVAPEEAPVVMEQKEVVPVKQEEEKVLEIKVQTNTDQAAKPNQNNSDFATSVKIAGLTDDTIQAELAVEEDVDTDSEAHSEEVLDVESLSDSDREELEDMSSLYREYFDPNKNPAGGISLDELLDIAIDKNASDIHFSADNKIGLRIDGEIFFIDNVEPLNRDQTRALIFSLVQNPLHRRRIFENKELDCAYEHKNGVNFRVNIFFKRGKLAAVLRIIASHAMTMEQLGLPQAIRELLGKKQGLLLVTGPTGSGKSTSMQTMLEYVNETRVEHILTIEDPIEYIFTSKKSIFSQREVGRDTVSFSNALRASLREDPDVVMIGEMRDAETIQAAMQLSETGHLVISTLHTSSAPQTVARLVSNFPSDEQEQVQSRLADTLIGVLSQRLVARADREGRVAIFELMIVNSAIRNIIRTGDMSQIHNAMMSGREIGMVLMKDYADNLAEQGIIHEESFQNFFREE